MFGPFAFSYLAFNETTHELIGHGFTAVEALSNGDLFAPDAPIYVLEARSRGAMIWGRNLTLPEAEKAIRRDWLGVLWP